MNRDVHSWIILCVVAVFLGCGLFGAVVGSWRAPLQGLYTGIKFPCLILLTLTANGVINGMLGQVLNTGLTFKQSFVASLMGFTVFALVVGSLAPVLGFLILIAPEPGNAASSSWHSRFLLTNTAIVAYAGIAGNLQAYRLLAAYCGQPSAALRTLLAWLGLNLFVGSQLAWLCRPIFGQPQQAVQFLRPNFNESNFFENAFFHLQRFFS